MKHIKSQNHNREWTPTQDSDQETCLLTIIQENTQLTEEDQTHFQHLLDKCKNQTMDDEELSEYQTLSHQLDTRNLKRIGALMALAGIKGRRYRKQ